MTSDRQKEYESWPEYWVLLEIPKNNPETIRLLLKHRRCPTWDKYTTDEYYYDEGTCPTNYLGRDDVQCIAEGDDTDPHGVFQFVKTWPVKPGEHEDDVMAQAIKDEEEADRAGGTAP